MCTLMNIKTGGCSEDCSYCAQSSKYQTGLKASKMVTVESVLDAARIAKDNGSTRFCMGAAVSISPSLPNNVSRAEYANFCTRRTQPYSTQFYMFKRKALTKC